MSTNGIKYISIAAIIGVAIVVIIKLVPMITQDTCDFVSELVLDCKVINIQENSVDERVRISDIVNEYKEKTIYVSEDGEYIPYIILNTDNYGDAFLLMRKDVYPKELQYRNCEIFGAGGSYYPGSTIDEFMEKELFSKYSNGVKKAILNSPVKIHTKDYVSKLIGEKFDVFEIIYRHVFALSLSECIDNITFTEDEKEGSFIPELKNYPIKKNVWLRSEAYGGDDTWASQIYNGNISSARIAESKDNYVRPVFAVAKNTEVKKINGLPQEKEGYTFVEELD